MITSTQFRNATNMSEACARTINRMNDKIFIMTRKSAIKTAEYIRDNTEIKYQQAQKIINQYIKENNSY